MARRLIDPVRNHQKTETLQRTTVPAFPFGGVPFHHCPYHPMKTKQTYPWRLIVSGALFLTAIFATACNTTEGFGKDVESLGENISDEASEAND